MTEHDHGERAKCRIEATDYKQPNNKYSHPWDEDVQERALDDLVRYASIEMREKLLKKMREGYLGWDEHRYQGVILKSLWNHVLRAINNEPRQWLDVAILAIMLWNLSLPSKRDEQEAEDA